MKRVVAIFPALPVDGAATTDLFFSSLDEAIIWWGQALTESMREVVDDTASIGRAMATALGVERIRPSVSVKKTLFVEGTLIHIRTATGEPFFHKPGDPHERPIGTINDWKLVATLPADHYDSAQSIVEAVKTEHETTASTVAWTIRPISTGLTQHLKHYEVFETLTEALENALNIPEQGLICQLRGMTPSGKDKGTLFFNHVEAVRVLQPGPHPNAGTAALFIDPIEE